MDFIRLKNIDNSDWKKVFEIYKESFPKYELRNIEDHEEAMKDDKFFCVYVKDEDKLVGIIFYWEWEHFRYIEHFAVNSKLRGGRYGSRIIEKLCKDDKTTILEIDPIVDEISERRLVFYERLGFVMNKFTHLHPPYKKDDKGHELKVLSYKRTINDKEFENFETFLENHIMKYSE
ncbi:MAG: GNAT family N-acetyltransferase [Clostridium sp.]|uniref:GNAT family N-acetyltransferase n=1 Tax=Clostridium sp. TaxID=1506 RepID=UPI002FCC25D5